MAAAWCNRRRGAHGTHTSLKHEHYSRAGTYRAINVAINNSKEKRGWGRRTRWAEGQKIRKLIESRKYILLSFPFCWCLPKKKNAGNYNKDNFQFYRKFETWLFSYLNLKIRLLCFLTWQSLDFVFLLLCRLYWQHNSLVLALLPHSKRVLDSNTGVVGLGYFFAWRLHVLLMFACFLGYTSPSFITWVPFPALPSEKLRIIYKFI